MPVVPAITPAPFATAADLETLLQRTFTVAQAAAADLILNMATAEVRRITNQTISAVAGDVVTLDPPNGARLFLPELPVTAVTSIVLAGTTLNPATYYVYGDTGIVTYGSGISVVGSGGRCFRSWGWTPQSVVVTYNHGFATIPQTVRDVVLDTAAAMLDTYAAGEAAGVKSESIGNYSVTYDTVVRTMADVVGNRLDRYKLLVVA